MTTSRERCAVCDFPLATGADFDREDDGTLCWSVAAGGTAHRGPRIDWRARALEAEKQREESNEVARDALQRLASAEVGQVKAEARVEALEVALRRLMCMDGHDMTYCIHEDCGTCDECAARALLSATPPKPAPRPDVMAELEEARSEIIKLRVKNKFLREKVGYFRDDIESAAAGRDGCTGVFASPGSGSTPEAASLGAEHRPDATEALRVATEALEGLLSHLGEPMNPEDLSAHDFDCIADFEQARALVAAENRARAALDLLRAHVEPTPLETAVLTHTEKEATP